MNQLKCFVITLLAISLASVALILLCSPANYAIGAKNSENRQVKPAIAEIALNRATGQISGKKVPFYELLGSYTDAQIAQMTENTKNPIILQKLIKCESENQNIARPDSNGLISWGLLQFNGKSTWQNFSPLAGLSASSSPMNPIQAIMVADWMISHGFGKRWSCWKIEGLDH